MSPRTAAALRHHENRRSLREHLISTAQRLIAEAGTSVLTVRTIAREAGVADGVLYNHFADKEELLAHALHAHVRSVERGLGTLPAAGSEPVHTALRAYVEYGLAMHRAILPAFVGFLAQPLVLRKFSELDERRDDWQQRLADHLRAERDLGRIAADADVRTAAAMIVGICHEAVMSALLADGSTPHTGPQSKPRADSIVTTVLDGIRPRRPSPQA
ncbi:TetR/AcrR family transcriptional regulator [Actinomycetes bacterium KLBMP 9759]